MAYLPIPNVNTDLRPNAFSTSAGGVNSEALLTEFDIFQPWEMPMLYHRRIGRLDFKNKLLSLGFRRRVSNVKYGHFELPWHKNNITVNAVTTAAGGAGQAHIFNLATADHFDTGLTNASGAEWGSYPQVNQVWEILGSRIQVQIVAKDTTTDVDNHRLTVRPLDSTVNLGGAGVLDAGKVLAYVAPAYSEGTGMAPGQTKRFITYSNYDQIIKTGAQNTGSEATVETRLVGSQNPYSVIFAKDDLLKRHAEECSNALLFGQLTTNTALTQTSPQMGYNVQVKTTEGMVQAMEDSSPEDTYTAGAYVVDDYDDVTTIIHGQRSNTLDYMSFEGNTINRDRQNALLDFFANDNGFLTNWMTDSRTRYDEFGLNSPQDFVANLGFQAIKKNNVTMAFNTLHEFNDAVGFGASPSTYPTLSLICPMDTNSAVEVEGKGKTPLFGYNYRGFGKLDRENMFGTITGFGASATPVPATEYDIERSGMLSHIGFHIVCANWFVIQKAA